MKVLLGLSGGMDSAYAARLLSEGHTVEGAVLMMHDHTDISAAKRAANETGIPLHVIDAKEKFRHEVEEYFISEYRQGRTPNPCTLCNPRVKIGELCRFAALNGFDKVATGHYARIKKEGERYCVAIGEDQTKDQSYMLWGLSQEQIKMLVFPLGDMKKTEVRENAQRDGLSSADSKESQDICFIPDGDHISYLEAHSPPMEEGSFVDENGNILGKHKGIMRYTVGQRRGLGIALGQRMFVSEIRADKNEIVLQAGGGSEASACIVDSLNFQLIPPPDEGEIKEYQLFGKLRYAARPVLMTVKVSKNEARAEFSEPIRAVTPGQSAVFYLDGAVAFGGIIKKAVTQ